MYKPPYQALMLCSTVVAGNFHVTLTETCSFLYGLKKVNRRYHMSFDDKQPTHRQAVLNYCRANKCSITVMPSDNSI